MNFEYKIININELDNEAYNLFYDMMSVDRKNRVDRLKQMDDKKRTIAGEYLAKKMIAEKTKTAIDEISISYDENGKPYSVNHNVEFSISHSNDLVACVISNCKTGIDIEQVQDIKIEISRKFYDDEYEYINSKDINADERLTRFFKIWTFKEAYLKMKGYGLSRLKDVPSYFESKKTIETVDNYIVCIVDDSMVE